MVDPVEPFSLKSNTLAQSLIEHAYAATNDPLRLTGAIWRPGEPEARREIQVAAQVILILIAQPPAEGEVRSDSPVVLKEYSEVNSSHADTRITPVYGELSCAPAEFSHLAGRETLTLEQHCSAIAFDAVEAYRIRQPSGADNRVVVGVKLGPDTPRKDVGAAEIRL